LNLLDVVCLFWVLVLLKVALELRVGQLWAVYCGVGEGGAWVLGCEFVGDFAAEGDGDAAWVFLIGDRDGADAFSYGVDVQYDVCMVSGQ